MMPTNSRIHRRIALRLVVLSIALPGNAATSEASPVFVQAAEQGQGLLRERNGECFVVTPEHVVRDSTEITVTAQGRIDAAARLDTTLGEDVAILRITDKGRFGCGMPWDEAVGLDPVIAGSTDGMLVTTSGAGAVQRRFVKVVGYNHASIRFRPAEPADAFFKTLSGGLLEIGGRPAGVLLQVDTANGNGIAIRMDHLSDVVRSFFAVQSTATAMPVDGFTIRPLDFRAIAANRTKVFESPDRMAATLDSIDVGSTFQVTGQVNERLWFRVQIKGTTGYIPTTAAKRL